MSDKPPPYRENPFTGLLTGVGGGLAVEFGAGAGPPKAPAEIRLELFNAAAWGSPL